MHYTKIIFFLLFFSITLVANTFSTSITHSSDDAEQEVGNHRANLTSSDLELVYDGHQQIVGMRFTNIDIPKNATITNAYVTFHAKSSNSKSLSLKISAEDNGNSATFTDEKRNISNRAKTSTINWNNINAWSENQTYNTPDISNLIQHVIDRSDWNRNNPITIFIEKKSSNHKRRAYSYDGNSNKAPKLTIEYTTPGGSNGGSSNTADICYAQEYTESTSWLSVCLSFGGLNCRNVIPIVNTSNTTLTQVKVYLQSNGIMQAGFNETAGVKEGEGSATIQSGATAGPISALGKNITYTLDDMGPDSSDTRDTYTESTIGIDFTNKVLYSTYVKNGLSYNVQVYPCDENITIPILNINDATITSQSSDQVMNFTLNIDPSATTGAGSSVQYHTIDGTAKAGVDYEETNGTITLPTDGSTTVNIPITIKANGIGEFYLILEKPYNATIDDNNATGTIEEAYACINYDTNKPSDYIDIGDLPDKIPDIHDAGDIVENMNHVDTNKSACIYGSSQNDDYDYYYFVVDANGILSINASSPNNHEYKLKVTTDNGFSYGTETSKEHNMSNISLHAGDSVYLRVKETGNDTDEYEIHFDFKLSDHIAGDRDFELRNPPQTRNIRGNYVMGGNINLCEDDGSGHCKNNNSNSNNHPDIYIDIDNDSSTKNSSSFDLNIPANSEVVWAGLYWQGVTHVSVNNGDFLGSTIPSSAVYLSNSGSKALDMRVNSYDSEKVKFKVPGASYVEVTADQLDYSNLGYAGFKDVTQMINKTNPNGTYLVADIKCHTGPESDHGNYGGWSLVVIYKNSAQELKNISVFDGFATVDSSYNKDINVSGFLTSEDTPLQSKISFFTMDGEGGSNSLTIVSDAKGSNKVSGPGNPANSLFNSTIIGVNNRQPDVPSLRMDLDTIDLVDYIGPLETDVLLRPRTTGDRYTASLFIFSAPLYEPRVCYYIDTIVDNNNNVIFEDKHFTEPINSGEEYTFNFWISNMKKDVNDTNLATAKLVQIYLNMSDDFTYTTNSTYIKNLQTNSFTHVTDTKNDDLGDYENNKSTWRVGTGADATQGGTLEPAQNFDDNDAKAYTHIKGKLNIQNSDTINLLDYLEFKASFQTTSITIAEDNAQVIEQCVDLNSSGSVGAAPGGLFNVVMQNNATAIENDGIDPLASEHSTLNNIPTQIANKDFNISVVSLDTDNKTLKNYRGVVALELIEEPDYSATDTEDQKRIKCENATTIFPSSTDSQITYSFNNNEVSNGTFNYTGAHKKLSFRVKYLKHSTNNGAITWNCTNNTNGCIWGMLNSTYHSSAPCQDVCKPGNGTGANQKSDACIACVFGSGVAGSSCSRDAFAIRPEKFVLNPPSDEDIELLDAGKDYNLSLIATLYNSTSQTSGYTITSANNVLETNQTLYDASHTQNSAMQGTLTFASNNFDITNGQALNNVGINFDDVGLVNIRIVDKTWAQVDIDNSDTTADCSENGAYVCGDINATFIPHHFTFQNVTLHNAHDGVFTYFSNDLNESVRFNFSILAKNKEGNTTKNFSNGLYEHPIDINFTVSKTVDGNNANKQEFISLGNIGFNNGTTSIAWNDTNTTKLIMFNYPRTSTTTLNPVDINGSTDVTINAISTYNSSSGTTKSVQGTSNASAKVTFLYGRAHAQRQKFTSSGTGSVTGNARLFYEVYCNGSGCDKTLLPDGNNAKMLDDPRWFVNTQHNPAQDGNITNITQKGTSVLTFGTTSSTSGETQIPITYDGSRGYPYKATIQYTPSSWLLYNKYNAAATQDEFEVEFINGDTNWAGQTQTDTTTNKNAAQTTNRRLMW